MFVLAMSFSAAGQQPAGVDKPIATGFLHKTLTIEQEAYAYCVYVPPEYTAEKPWPVILFLHGSGERGRDGFAQTEIGIARLIRRRHDLVPAIVVMPQCRPKTGWVGQMAKMALRCVEATSREYRCDSDRVYLTGLSMGGNGAWLLAAQFPQSFAAVVPICGFAELRESTGLAEKLAPRLTDLPIWCFHGDADTNVPVGKSRELVAAIRSAGGTIKYTEYKGGTHNVWDRAYGSKALWKWLFAQKRPSKPGSP